MKKIFLFISPIIAFLLGGILFPFYSKAAAVPSTQTFTVMENTAEQLFNFGFVPQSLMPYGDISTSTWDAWQTGGVLLNFDLSDCEITELNNDQKSELLSNWTVVNTSNITVTTTDKIYSVKMDNGYFTGYVYVDEDGNMLSYTNDLGGQLLQVKYGGSIKSSEDWQELYESTATKIYEANFHYFFEDPDKIPNSANTYYRFQGVNQGGNNPIKAQELFIPNQYQKGVVVPNCSYSGQIINSWYANNITDAVILNTVFSNSDNSAYDIFRITRGTYKKDNVTYNYFIELNSWTDVTTPNNTYQNWRNYNNVSNVVFASQSTSYDPSLLSTEKSTSFKPLQIPEGSEILNYDDYYDYNAIQRLEQEIAALRQTINNQFNNQQQVSEENFPFYYPTGNTEMDPSEIPFPGVVNYPNFNPLPVPETVPMPDPATAPSIGSDVGEVDPNELRSGIPIINNLLNRFPFSIPWDIYSLLNGFVAERETPYIDTTVTIPVVNYEWHIEYDLSDFNGVASLFRTLFLISFILGLAYFSYDHFFGS